VGGDLLVNTDASSPDIILISISGLRGHP